MSATPRFVILLLALLVASCFTADPSHIVFKCDAANPCLDGQSCIGGYCKASTQVGDLAADFADAGMMMNTGCADNRGSAVGQSWACPGAFAAGHASDLCKTGWSLPTDATKVDLTKCNQLSGFFIANVPGKYLPPWGSSVSCIQGNPFENKVFFGCGAVSAPDYQTDSGATCSGFGRAVNCPTASKSWDCPTGNDLSLTSNQVTTDGVLCTK